MTLGGLTLEANSLVFPGTWCLWCGDQLIGMISKERRDFMAQFGLQVELPARTTKITVDHQEYDRLCVGLRARVEGTDG